jgi:AraC-like DNA-binding protein
MVKSTASPDVRHDAVRDLCSRLFADPARLTQTLSHTVEKPFRIQPHEHADLLQLDLLAGCHGRAWSDGSWHRITGTTAMVAYPGQSHGYELTPGEPPSRVYHLRVLAEPTCPVVEARPYAPLLTNLHRMPQLTAAMRVVVRLGVVERVRPPLLIARLCEALCLWPDADGHDTPAPSDEPEELERGLYAAVDLIDARMTDPPSVDELARIAHFSARHFARRFEAAFGCTPHTYINARRFALARKLLSQERLRVSDIAREVGFNSVASFSRWFTQQSGASPTAFREDPSVM